MYWGKIKVVVICALSSTHRLGFVGLPLVCLRASKPCLRHLTTPFESRALARCTYVRGSPEPEPVRVVVMDGRKKMRGRIAADGARP